MTEKTSNLESERKVSAMIAEIGDGYIQMGNDLFQRENYLRSVVTAWNIACLPKYKQTSAIVKLVKQFNKLNPGCTIENTKNYADDIRQLIKRKNELYPAIKLKILDCSIKDIDGKEHVSVVFLPLISGKIDK